MKKTVYAGIVDGGDPEHNWMEPVDILVEKSMQQEHEGASLVTLRQPEVMTMRKDMAIGYLQRLMHEILSA